MTTYETTAVTHPYPRRTHFETLVAKAQEWGFNHRASAEILEDFDDTNFYEIDFAIPHYHRDGEPCETHMRLGFRFGSGPNAPRWLVDMPMDFFEQLPFATTILIDDQPILTLPLNESGEPTGLLFPESNVNVQSDLERSTRSNSDEGVRQFVRGYLAAQRPA